MATIIKRNVVDRSKFPGKLLFIDKAGNVASTPARGRRKKGSNKKKGKRRR